MMSRMYDLKKMMSERRVGFCVDEVMTGTHRFKEGAGPKGELFMGFRITWGNRHFVRFLNPFGDEFFTCSLRGRVTIDGLVKDADCKGRLELRYFTEAKILYIFDFKDEEGNKYHYVGEKVNIRPWNLHRTHTTCYGTLTEVGSRKVVSRSTTYFRLKTIPSFLLSMRLG